jgi:hypothetical protein
MIFEKMGKWLSNITKFINFLIFWSKAYI